MKTIGHLIAGQSRQPDGRTADVYNPATGKVAAKVHLANRKTVEEAIEAAQKAFPAWRNTPFEACEGDERLQVAFGGPSRRLDDKIFL